MIGFTEYPSSKRTVKFQGTHTYLITLNLREFSMPHSTAEIISFPIHLTKGGNLLISIRGYKEGFVKQNLKLTFPQGKKCTFH